MAEARSEHPAAVIGEEVVVAGGFIEVGVGRTGVTPKVEAYQPETDTWHPLVDLPEARHHGMAASIGGRLFFIGGFTPSGDPSTSVWELVEDGWVDRRALPSPVAAGAAVSMGDIIFVVGGVPDGKVYSYDASGNTWGDVPAPGTRREHVAAVALDGDIWAIAGRWAGEIFATTEIYDPDAGAWRAGPSLREARSGFGAVVVDQAIVVAGGEVFSPDEALDSVERLEPAGTQWAAIQSLPRGLHGNPLVAIGNHVYLPGGSIRPAAVDNDGVTYHLQLG
jgi:N-acetylneuraminic acid mutarotase